MRPLTGFNFIVGTFERAISILEKYSPSDFHSAHIYGYVIGALKKNSLYFEQVQNGFADGEEMVVAAEDDEGDDDGNDNNNGNFFRSRSNYGSEYDDDDNNDDNNRDMVGGNDHQNDKLQQHYICIFNLANK
jgi:hypothetical protein